MKTIKFMTPVALFAAVALASTSASGQEAVAAPASKSMAAVALASTSATGEEAAASPASKSAAGAAYCGRGAWNRSNRPGLTRAYPPSWFTGRLTSLTARWKELNSPQASSQLTLAL